MEENIFVKETQEAMTLIEGMILRIQEVTEL